MNNNKIIYKILYFSISAIWFWLIIVVLGFKTETIDGYANMIGTWRLKQVIVLLAFAFLFSSALISIYKIDHLKSVLIYFLTQAALLFALRSILLGVFSALPDPNSKSIVVTASIIIFITNYVQLQIFIRNLISRGPIILFSVLAAPLLIINIFLSLPVSAPDSYSHIVSAYRYSNILLGYSENDGYLMQVEDYAYLASISDGFEFGKTTQPNCSIYETELNSVFMRRAESLEDVMIEVEGYNHMAYYSALCWLPQIIGLAVGRIIGLNPIMLFTFARLMCGLLFFAVCIEAIRITPVGKYVFCGLALFPICLDMAVSFNYDSLVLISVIGFVSNILRIKYSENYKLSHVVETMIFAIMLGGVKGGGFIPMIILGVIWSKKVKNLIISSAITVSGIASYVVFNKILPAEMQFFQLHPLSDVTMSADYAIHYPIRYLSRIIYMYFEQADSLLASAVGRTYIPHIVLYGIAMTVIVLIMLGDFGKTLNKRDQSVIWILIIMGLLITPATILVGNVPEVFVLQGVQGRYYLPVILLGLLLVGTNNRADITKMKLKDTYVKLTFVVLEFISVLFILL